MGGLFFNFKVSLRCPLLKWQTIVYLSPVVKGSSGNGANLIECAELEGDTVDTFGEGVADVDAADGLDESANLQEVLREICKN